jgi:hypothetical protein
MHEQRCQGCGKKFTSTNPAKWCSDACKQAAYRDRKAALHPPKPPHARKNRRKRLTDPDIPPSEGTRDGLQA